MISDLSAYLYALWHNWLLVMAGGPFLVDRLAKWWWAGYDAWFKQHRRRIVARTSFAGVVLAGFLAFRAEHHSNMRLAATLGDSGREWAALSGGQKDSLAAALRPLIKPNFYTVIGYVQNDSSIDFAQELKEIFRRAGAQHASAGLTGQEKENRYGIVVYVKNPDHMDQRDAAVVAAFRSVNLPAKAADIGDAYTEFSPYQIVIAYPPA